MTFLFILVNPILGGISLAHAMLRYYILVEVEWRLSLARFRVYSLSSLIGNCWMDNLRPGGAI
jgi:acetyl-CoA carboxylase beta subunit